MDQSNLKYIFILILISLLIIITIIHYKFLVVFAGLCGLLLIGVYIRSKENVVVGVQTELKVKITEVSGKTIYGSNNRKKILLSGFFEYDILNLDDEIIVNGTLKKIELIDYGNINYFKSKNVNYFFEVKKILKYFPNKTIRGRIINYFQDGGANYQKYINLLFLGQKNWENSQVYDIAVQNSVVHLFVISGFHIILFSKIFSWLMTKLKINKKLTNIIIITILLMYLYLINFTIPAIRAFLIYWIWTWNQLFFKKKISKFNLVIIVAISFLIYNPYQIYNFSYILTFLATFCVIIVTKWQLGNNLRKYILTTTIVFFGTLPITIYFNDYINLIGIIQILVMTPIISVFYLVMILFIFIKPVLEPLFQLLNFILLIGNKLNIILTLTKWPAILIISYYCFFSLILYTGNIKLNIKNNSQKVSL